MTSDDQRKAPDCSQASQRQDVERFAARARELMREWSKEGFEVEVPSRTVTELEAWKFLAYFTALCERLDKEHSEAQAKACSQASSCKDEWNAMWETPFDWSKEKLQ